MHRVFVQHDPDVRGSDVSVPGDRALLRLERKTSTGSTWRPTGPSQPHRKPAYVQVTCNAVAGDNSGVQRLVHRPHPLSHSSVNLPRRPSFGHELQPKNTRRPVAAPGIGYTTCDRGWGRCTSRCTQSYRCYSIAGDLNIAGFRCGWLVQLGAM